MSPMRHYEEAEAYLADVAQHQALADELEREARGALCSGRPAQAENQEIEAGTNRARAAELLAVAHVHAILATVNRDH